MNCPQCGVANAVENAFCSACGGSLRATGGTKSSSRRFRDPTNLTRWLRWLLIAALVAYAVAGVSELVQYQLLTAMRDGGFSSETEARQAAEANDLRQGVIAMAGFIVVITTVVVFAIWIHRVDSNIHALGSFDLRFTPGWAVGWYFVPIANLWKPYQAMSEIWRASKNPTDWQSEPTSGLLRWWWFWWLVSSLLDNVSMRMSLRADELNELIGVAPVNIASSILDIISAIFALMLVKKIGEFQAEAADRSLTSVFA